MKSIYHLYDAYGSNFALIGDKYVCGATATIDDHMYKFVQWYFATGFTGMNPPLVIDFCPDCVNHPDMAIHELNHTDL